MKIKPQNAKGTRDFLPQEVIKRKYLFNLIAQVFQNHAFEEIETPAMENLITLTGKYGEEGDQLLFKILNSGEYLSKVSELDFDAKNYAKISTQIAEKGLRYDLTVPLARYVVQRQNDLNFPFKRFHVGPVWRADRPQKGRYREFYQFDADIIGSDSLLNEIELTQVFVEVFEKIGLNYQIRINHRKMLEAVAHYANCSEKLSALTIAIDKMDKIAWEGVKNELTRQDFQEDSLQKIEQALQIKSLNDAEQLFGTSSFGQEAIAALSKIMNRVDNENLVFDISLARGLSYYTGTIWEVISPNSGMGSIASGGRYANLTEMFGGQNMSGVGISFGVERIFDLMQEQNLFPATLSTVSQMMIINFGENYESEVFKIIDACRKNHIRCEYYPDAAKLQKQMKYANAKNIENVLFVGEEEIKSATYQLKNMHSGEQQQLTLNELINHFTA